MIRKFFDNKIGSLTLVILVIMLIRIPIYFVTNYHPNTTLNTGILSNFINEINSVRWISFALSFMVVIIEGLIVNKLCWEYNIVEKPGYVILYFFAIVNSCFLENFYLSNVQLGNVFVLIGLTYFYLYIKNNYQRKWLFLSALFFGMSALCIAEHYWVIIFLIFAIILFKPILPLDIFAILFGLTMPYYLVSAIGYLSNFSYDFYNTWEFWVIRNKTLDFHWLKDGPEILLLFLLLIFVFVGVLQVVGSYFRSNVETRRSKLAMLIFGFYVLSIFFIRFKDYSHYFIVASIPVSIFISGFYEGNKWRKWKEFLHLSTLLFLLYTLFRNSTL